MSINIECLSIWRAPRALGLAKLVTPNTNIDTRALMQYTVLQKRKRFLSHQQSFTETVKKK